MNYLCESSVTNIIRTLIAIKQNKYLFVFYYINNDIPLLSRYHITCNENVKNSNLPYIQEYHNQKPKVINIITKTILLKILTHSNGCYKFLSTIFILEAFAPHLNHISCNILFCYAKKCEPVYKTLKKATNFSFSQHNKHFEVFYASICSHFYPGI